MNTYWDAFVDEHPRRPDEDDRMYLERFWHWLQGSTPNSVLIEASLDAQEQAG